MTQSDIVEIPQPLGLFAGDLFNRAQEYLSAFEYLTERGNERKFPYASFFLLAHAIELLLKSYLAAKGVPKKELKSKFSHKLCLARDECERLLVPDVPELKLLIERLNDMNEDYDFRYPSGYVMQFPPVDHSLKIAKDFSHAIRGTIEVAHNKAEIQLASDMRHHQGKQVQWSD